MDQMEFSEGGEEALAAAIRQYGQGLLRYCHHILCDYHEAQDAVQITFCKAWERRTRCRTGALPAWLYRMAYTTCVDILRQRNWRVPHKADGKGTARAVPFPFRPLACRVSWRIRPELTGSPRPPGPGTAPP